MLELAPDVLPVAVPVPSVADLSPAAPSLSEVRIFFTHTCGAESVFPAFTVILPDPLALRSSRDATISDLRVSVLLGADIPPPL